MAHSNDPPGRGKSPDPFDPDADAWAREMVRGLPLIPEADLRALAESAKETEALHAYRLLQRARLVRDLGERGLALDEKPDVFRHVNDYPYGRLYRVIDQRGRTVAPADRPGCGAWSFDLDDVDYWLLDH
ncbi:hypothetical protein ABZV77_03890 [Streptomyces sp. NPDC004732]|uniref:hypothetical protein n=1 Tax=Streptomyces sp. NPDC004732 TaxID=3154290 RepID=UPI0033A36D74